MVNTQPYLGFEDAARATLKMLHERLGFDLWMVTRTEGNDWIVLQTENHGYDVKEGAVFNWADSFCSQMVLGKGPRIAPRSADVQAYADAPIGRRVTIGAYVGVPLVREDGSLFGTLCAIHPDPQPAVLVAELSWVETVARLLSTILESDLKASAQMRRAEQAEAEALTDALTGLYNRRGWERLLASEDGRCRTYGTSACVVSIDLDGLKRVNDGEGHAQGDELIRRAARAIRTAVRSQDVVARVGGDEFVVLGVECDAAGGDSLQERLSVQLAEARVEASLGVAVRKPGENLSAALERADHVMYARKRGQRQLLCV